MKHTLTAVGAAAALALMLTACGTDPDPAPSTPAASATVSATPTPSETPLTPEEQAAALKDANIEAAKARLVDYYATYSRVAAAGFQDWQTQLTPFMGSAQATEMITGAVASESSLGLTFSGASTVSSMTVTAYTEDPTGSSNERVAMDACVDFSGIAAANPDGSPATPPDTYLPRALVQVEMHHLGPDQPWTIGAVTFGGVPC